MQQSTYHDHVMKMDREAFLKALERARAEKDDAATVLAWGERLMPYLEAHPDWTLQQAIDAFGAETR